MNEIVLFTRSLVRWTVDAGMVCMGLAIVLCIWRLLRGPHLADRALALDTVAINLIALVLLMSMRYHTLNFIDSVLVLSLLGFGGTVAAAQYIGRPHLQRPAAGEARARSASPGTPGSSGTPGTPGKDGA